MTTGEKTWSQEGDGFLLALMYFGAEEFGWTLDYVLDEVSILSLLLLLRQKATAEGHPGITLAQQELIDSRPWEELVAENRKKIRELTAKGFFD